MDLETYTLSMMCHDEQAVRYGLVQLRREHFTGQNQKLFTVIKALFQEKRTVDLHVLASQFQAVGGNSGYAAEIYNYSLGQTDEWKNVFQELIDQTDRKRVLADLQETMEMARNGKSVKEIATDIINRSGQWINKTEKQYHSGKEIDEQKEIYGAPVLTGYPIIDEELYKFGGNRKGQMCGIICRHKHGKTRSACWEVAQNIRQGFKVLYLTLEGTRKDIVENVRQVLREDWKDYRENLFVVDGKRTLSELQMAVIEAVMVEEIDKLVVDYIQNVIPDEKYSGENEKINISTETFRHLMVKYNFACTVLSQARKSSINTTAPKNADGEAILPRGWRHVPAVDDAYGSQALVNASHLILIGYRPNQYTECIQSSPLGNKVVNPIGEYDPLHSFYMQTAITRGKPEHLHRWFRFQDSVIGLQNPGWVQ